jgi:hypothetical protein
MHRRHGPIDLLNWAKRSPHSVIGLIDCRQISLGKSVASWLAWSLAWNLATRRIVDHKARRKEAAYPMAASEVKAARLTSETGSIIEPNIKIESPFRSVG